MLSFLTVAEKMGVERKGGWILNGDNSETGGKIASCFAGGNLFQRAISPNAVIF